MKSTLVIALLILSLPLRSQTAGTATSVPPVFLIGQYEDQYYNLTKQYPSQFASMFDNDMDNAFRQWTGIMMDLEDYADAKGLDIRGAKLWLKVYFNKNGKLEHLAYFPKPNSKHIPTEYLDALFKNFVRDYYSNIVWEKGYQHSTNVSFPTYYSRLDTETARKH